MNVRTSCLAFLYECKATGYEIRKLSVEGEYAYFVDASYGSIYPALAKLDAENLVTSHVKPQDGKPAKKIYAITPAGKRAFIASLFEDLSDDDFRSEFLLFARFASELPASLVETRLKERLSLIESEIAQLEKLSAEDNHPADAWVLNYGMTCITVARDYIRAHMGELIALARPDAAAAHAAE